MDVKGSVVFDGNTAVFGAGVAMSGRSLVRYMYNIAGSIWGRWVLGFL